MSNSGRIVTAFAAVLCVIASPARATIDIALQMQLGNATAAGTSTNDHDHYLVQRTVQSLDFSDNLGEPRWASWDLTSADIGSAPRSTSFYVDTNLPPNFYRVKTADYNNTGYDRGHMCTSEDRTDTTNNNKLVFFMSNIVPQDPDNNQGPWAAFENFCQGQAMTGSEILITCGGSGFDGTTFTNGKVDIPGYTWKIAVIVPPGAGTALSRITSTTRVVSIKIPNISGIRTTPWTNYLTSGNQIQTDTAYLLMTNVASSISDVLLAKVDGSPAPSISGFSPTNGPIGTNVTISGANFTGASKVKFYDNVSASFTVNSSTQIVATVPVGATNGPICVIAPGGLATSANTFQIGGVGKIVISQVYGGGGNAGSTFKNDFIELYNSGSGPVDLSTYAVQYAGSTSSNWSQTVLSGTLSPGHYYLIQEAAGGGGVSNLPTPQATGAINMSATAGKVAVTKTTTLLTVSNPVGSADVVDFVGYGSANAYEGAGAAPAPSATVSDLRAGAGATDTDSNSADFSTGAVNPRNY